MTSRGHFCRRQESDVFRRSPCRCLWLGRPGEKKKNPERKNSLGVLRGAGGGLLSRDLSIGVPSALQGLTTVFGMGTGVAPALQPPAIRFFSSYKTGK